MSAAHNTCREVRDAVAKFYPLSFGLVFRPGRTRFNFSLDTLYLGWPFNGDNKVERFFDLWNKHDFSHLRYLAVHEEVFGVDFVFGKDQAMAKRVLGAALEHLCGLKELIYVCDVMEHGESKISVPFNEKGPMLLFKNWNFLRNS